MITTGGFVVELVFAIPGLGRYFVEAVQQLDYTVIMGTTVFYGAFLVLHGHRRRRPLRLHRPARDARMSATPSGNRRPSDFAKADGARRRRRISRPSLSYWQDAWRRLQAQRARARFARARRSRSRLFTVAGPWVWRVDPAAQDVDQISRAPGLPATAASSSRIMPWAGVTTSKRCRPRAPRVADGLRLAEPATTQAVRLVWEPAAGAAGYHIYRNIYDPAARPRAGAAARRIVDPHRVSFEDRFDLEAVRVLVLGRRARRERRRERTSYAVLDGRRRRSSSAPTKPRARGWIADERGARSRRLDRRCRTTRSAPTISAATCSRG